MLRRSVGAVEQGMPGGFSEVLMGAANAFFTAEAVDEAVDLVEEAGRLSKLMYSFDSLEHNF